MQENTLLVEEKIVYTICALKDIHFDLARGKCKNQIIHQLGLAYSEIMQIQKTLQKENGDFVVDWRSDKACPNT